MGQVLEGRQTGRPWVTDVEARIILEVLEIPPIRLDDVAGGLGAYLLLYIGENLLYEPISQGRRPIYVGNSSDLCTRMSDHTTSLNQASGLGVEDFLAVVYPVGTKGVALMAEETLRRVFEPVWNVPCFAGFGSKNQGKNRVRYQVPTAWDRLHPGREWLDGHPSRPNPELRKGVKKYVGDQVPLSAWRSPGGDRSRTYDPVLVSLGRTSSEYRFALSGSELAVIFESFARRPVASDG